MKIALVNLTLILTFVFPADSWAQELESWLKNSMEDIPEEMVKVKVRTNYKSFFTPLMDAGKFL